MSVKKTACITTFLKLLIFPMFGCMLCLYYEATVSRTQKEKSAEVVEM